MGEAQPSQDLLTEYEKRAKEVEDEQYAKLEVDPIDVKEI